MRNDRTAEASISGGVSQDLDRVLFPNGADVWHIQLIRRNVSLDEIGMIQRSIESGRGSDIQIGKLMNIVMQFRKVSDWLSIFCGT